MRNQYREASKKIDDLASEKEELNEIVNLAAIEKITQQRFDEAIKVFDDRLETQMADLEPVNIYEEAESNQNEMSEEEMLRAIMGESEETSDMDNLSLMIWS